MNLFENADTTWIESILLDGGDNDATVTLNVPMDPTAGTASYEEIIDFDSPVTPAYLVEAARLFANATIRFVKERDAAKLPEGVEVKCTTCTGACCARVYSEITVTTEDLGRLGVDNVQFGVALYPHGESWTGARGTIKRTSWHGEGEATWESDDKPMACVFLSTKTSFCTIYDQRPEICRTYTAHDCDVHEEAPQKLITLRRKALKSLETKETAP